MTWIKASLAYTALNALIAAMQFSTLLFLSNRLSAQDYGFISIYYTYYVIFNILCGLGLSSAVQRAYFGQDKSAARRLVLHSTLYIFGTGLLVSIALILLTSFFSVAFGLPLKWILIALISAVFYCWMQLHIVLYQSMGLIYLCNKININLIYFQAVSLGVFGLIGGNSLTAAFFMIALPLILTGLLSSIHFLTKFYIEFNPTNRNEISDALKYSLPLVPHQAAAWILTLFDRFIILSFLGPAAVGQYSFIYQLAVPINILSTSINQALVPIAFNLLQKKDIGSFKKINITTISAILISALMYYFFIKYFALNLFDTRYHSTINIFPALLISFVFLSIARLVGNVFLFFNKTMLLATITGLSAMVSFALNFTLAPLYGLEGVACASIGGFLFLIILSSLYLRYGKRLLVDN